MIARGGTADLRTEEANLPSTSHVITLDHSNYVMDSETTMNDITNPGTDRHDRRAGVRRRRQR